MEVINCIKISHVHGEVCVGEGVHDEIVHSIHAVQCKANNSDNFYFFRPLSIFFHPVKNQ